MKVIIAGSRDITSFDTVREAVKNSGFTITEVVSGTAKGVDTLGERWARGANVPIKRFPSNWKRDGRTAGIVRNVEMAKYGEALIAVWDGESPGTKHMIAVMRKLRKPVFVVDLSKPVEMQF